MHTYPFFLVNSTPTYYKRREKERKKKDFHQQIYLKGSKLNGILETTADIQLQFTSLMLINIFILTSQMCCQKMDATVHAAAATGFHCVSQSGNVAFPQLLTLFILLPANLGNNQFCVLFLINVSWCLIALLMWHLISNCHFTFLNIWNCLCVRGMPTRQMKMRP